MPTYVRSPGGLKWHWCEGCSSFPGTIAQRSSGKPPKNALCRQCLARERNGECRRHVPLGSNAYLAGMPTDGLRGVVEGLTNPAGMFHLTWLAKGFLSPSADALTYMLIPAGRMVFALERDPDLVLRFFHTTPGRGTLASALKLDGLSDAKKLDVLLVWKPDEVRLIAGDPDRPDLILEGEAFKPEREYRVDLRGRVHHFGNAAFLDYRVTEGDEVVLMPTAREAWQATRNGVETLLSAHSDQQMFGTAQCNLAFIVLCAGFEAYLSRRFLEVEGEGVRPALDELIRAFTSKAERQSGYEAEVRRSAARKGSSPLGELVERRKINFQNWEHAKRAYRKAYGIAFGQLSGVDSCLLTAIQRYLEYRHQAVHESPFTRILNQQWCPPETPLWAGPDVANVASSEFDAFLSSLHDATLALGNQPPRPPTGDA